MRSYHDELDAAVRRWRAEGLPDPEVALVTGSTGSFDLGAPVHGPFELTDWLPFPAGAIAGHTLTLEILEPTPDRFVLYFRGRLHCFQGFEAHQVAFCTRLAGLLGASVLLQTNAAGSLRVEAPPGTLSLVRDHLNLAARSPLVGELPSSWGDRFPALNDAYSPRLRGLAHGLASERDLSLFEGVYAWMLGPAYETPAEIGMCERLGADLVGMSTVPEILAARQLGMECLVLSLVTNLAAGMTDELPGHQEVLDVGRERAEDLRDLVAALLAHPDLTESSS